MQDLNGDSAVSQEKDGNEPSGHTDQDKAVIRRLFLATRVCDTWYRLG